MDSEPLRFSYRNLVYLFPGAAWVSQTFDLFKTTSSIYSIYLALIFFAFIPVEIYATSLWAREKGSFVGQRRTFFAAAVDAIGVFFLSLLYVAYATLHSMHGGRADESQVRLIFIGLGMLLFLNGLWNALQRPDDQDVFRSAQELASRRAELAQERLAKLFHRAVSKFMSVFRWVNFVIFGAVSPVFGCGLLIGVTWFDLAKHAAVGESAKFFSEVIVGYVSILTIWKLVHTYILTLMARQIDHSSPRGTATMLEVRGLHLTVIDIGDAAATRAAKFRFECMTEDMIHRSASTKSASMLPVARHFSRNEIARDHWDRSAVHIVVRDGEEVVGAVRVSFAIANRLPVLEHLSPDSKKKLSVGSFDVEISRLFVKRAFRRSHVTGALLFASARIVDLLSERDSGRIFADVPIGMPDLLKPGTYKKAGFTDTEISYFDDRYKALSLVLTLQIRDQLQEYRRRIERNYRRSAGLPRQS